MVFQIRQAPSYYLRSSMRSTTPGYLNYRLARQISVWPFRSATKSLFQIPRTAEARLVRNMGEGLLGGGPPTVEVAPRGCPLGFEFVFVLKDF